LWDDFVILKINGNWVSFDLTELDFVYNLF
jgi:hypothetical protein